MLNLKAYDYREGAITAYQKKMHEADSNDRLKYWCDTGIYLGERTNEIRSADGRIKLIMKREENEEMNDEEEPEEAKEQGERKRQEPELKGKVKVEAE